jgi:hypothetical protein
MPLLVQISPSRWHVTSEMCKLNQSEGGRIETAREKVIHGHSSTLQSSNTSGMWICYVHRLAIYGS